MTIEHKATVITITGVTRELDHQPTLSEAQGLVGGYIQLLKAHTRNAAGYPVRGSGVVLVVDEDGKFTGKPLNVKATALYGRSVYGVLVGDVVVLKGWKTIK